MWTTQKSKCEPTFQLWEYGPVFFSLLPFHTFTIHIHNMDLYDTNHILHTCFSYIQLLSLHNCQRNNLSDCIPKVHIFDEFANMNVGGFFFAYTQKKKVIHAFASAKSVEFSIGLVIQRRWNVLLSKCKLIFEIWLFHDSRIMIPKSVCFCKWNSFTLT